MLESATRDLVVQATGRPAALPDGPKPIKVAEAEFSDAARWLSEAQDVIAARMREIYT